MLSLDQQQQLSSLLALYRTVIVLVVDNANVKVAAGKSLSSQIEWLKCLLGRGIVLIQCSDALNAANEVRMLE